MLCCTFLKHKMEYNTTSVNQIASNKSLPIHFFLKSLPIFTGELNIMFLSDKGIHKNALYRKVNWKLGTVICPILLMMTMVVGLMVTKKRKRESKGNSPRIILELAREVLPKEMSFHDVAPATNNFSSKRILGQGGTGCVHKGYQRNPKCKVAVKRIDRGYKHAKEVFTAELSIMSQLEHRNIVPLIGWSNDEGEFLLVYGYMSNGSLNNNLLGNGKQLPWKVRFNIVLDLSSALLYLLEESEKCVLHRDIKSANVILDSKFNAKLGDFGAAIFLDHPDLALQTRKMAGTFGYVAPECYYQGRAGKAADVYSFGVVVLEIACGVRKHKDEESRLGLVEWVWELYRAGNFLEAADERLKMDFDKREVECLLIAGSWCTHPVANQRPKISQAIEVLKFEAPLPKLPFEMPHFLGTSALESAESSLSASITSES